MGNFSPLHFFDGFYTLYRTKLIPGVTRMKLMELHQGQNYLKTCITIYSAVAPRAPSQGSGLHCASQKDGPYPKRHMILPLVVMGH